MKSTTKVIHDLLSEALSKVISVPETITVSKPGAKIVADYISPVALSVFNKHKKEGCFGHGNPKALAEAIHAQISPSPLIQQIEVANNGFINIFVSRDYLSATISEICRSNSLSVDLGGGSERVLVDFSSPNIAKEMHVGHLRSTIIGDSLCRVLEFLGHTVMRVNHLGDWGTQFGMLLTYLDDAYPDWETSHPDISDLGNFYKSAKKRFDEDEDFKERSRLRVVQLQSGEEQAMKAWKYIFKVSRDYLQIIYDRLEIQLEDYGESFYNPMLPGVVQELTEKGIIEESEGAKVIRLENHPVPLMAQKKDGGYGYDSTDLAAVRYRLLELSAQRVVYVTDSGQDTHFFAIFDAARKVGWAGPEHKLEHVGFGVVLNEQGKKFKAREGESIKLVSLLDEAKERAGAQLRTRIQESNQQQTFLTEAEFDEAAEKIGIAAIKYYDLKQNRISTYKFSYEKMLDAKGDTAVYLIYAYARMNSILDKVGPEVLNEALAAPCILENPKEIALAVSISRFPEVLETVLNELNLHKLCDLLYDTSVKLSEFYTNCKVIGSPEQASRLQLCMAARILMKQCFDLIGIKPLNRI